MTTPIVLPSPLQGIFEVSTRALLDPGDRSSTDFSRPTGEAALVSPNSVSWRVFKNPLSLFIGGVTAVVMELAEPRVRTGVWEHTNFRIDPIRRLRRTGFAAMERGLEISREIPKSRFAMIRGGGHISSLDSPDQFNELLLEFLAAHFPIF